MNPFSMSDSTDKVFGLELSEISDMIHKDKFEKHMIDTSPAVKDAWEKYQAVLKLADHT